MPGPVFKHEEVTVVSEAADGENMFPSLCQILKALCSDLHRCSMHQRLMEMTGIYPELGTVQIMVGLFNIGLGPGRTSTSPGDLTSLGAAYWLGAVFIVTGIMSILAGQFPSSCLMGFTVFMNIAGAIFAVTAAVLYYIDLSNASILWICDRSRNDADYNGDACRDLALFAQSMLTHMDTMLIIMAALQFVFSVRVAVLGIKALTSEVKKAGRRVEDQQPQLKDVLLTGPHA